MAFAFVYLSLRQCVSFTTHTYISTEQMSAKLPGFRLSIDLKEGKTFEFIYKKRKRGKRVRNSRGKEKSTTK